MLNRFANNRRAFRLPAAFMALLYLLLSTFGALTHSHGALSLESVIEAASAVTVAPGATQNAHRLLAAAKRTLPVSDHCAYCSWQADSVSAALPIRHFAEAASHIALIFSLPALTPVMAFTPRASSRAPPCA